jgi:two-component system chemotaxis response regulator CheB
VQKSRVVAVGISTGGPAALAKMMPALPGDLDVPILIVQHLPPLYTQALAERLDSKCAIKVKEGSDGEALSPNTAYIAPGGSQMKVAKAPAPGSRELIIRITDDPPENGCKPSADYLFRSVVEHFGGRATGVIMTGMGSDGASGLRLMKAHGATIIAQDASTSVVFGMARKPIEEEIVDVIVPLDRIAEEIRRTVK